MLWRWSLFKLNFVFISFLWFFCIFQRLQSGGGVHRVPSSQSTSTRTADESRLVNACYSSWPIPGNWEKNVLPSITGTIGTPVLQCCVTEQLLPLAKRDWSTEFSYILCREVKAQAGFKLPWTLPERADATIYVRTSIPLRIWKRRWNIQFIYLLAKSFSNWISWFKKVYIRRLSFYNKNLANKKRYITDVQNPTYSLCFTGCYQLSLQSTNSNRKKQKQSKPKYANRNTTIAFLSP